VKIASYKGTQAGIKGIANWLIRLRLRGPHSHTEVVFTPDDNVGSLMPDGTTASIDGAYWCASSVASEPMPLWSLRRPGRHGGVRFKRIRLEPSKWDLQDTDRDPLFAARWFRAHEGLPYDWQLIVGFLAWFVPQDDDAYDCTEACAEACRFPDPFRFDPCNFFCIHAY
jgi:hypothetical protein